MKKVFLGLGLVCMALIIFGLVWLGPSRIIRPFDFRNTTSKTTPVVDPNAVTQSDWQQLRTVREAALEANPDLAAQYKELLAEMQAQQAKFDEAMIKADPKVAPIVAKMVALREQTMARASVSASTSTSK